MAEGYPTAIIGSRVRSRRERLRLSQLDLAEMLGCNRAYIARIERESRDTTMVRFVELCTALETSPNYLLGWTVRP